MTQDTLKRLFKSIEGGVNDDIVKIAYKIIEEEEQKGHNNLSAQLKNILEDNIRKNNNFKKELSNILDTPVSHRNKSPLVTEIPRQDLRHHMILDEETEECFIRIEKEYVARERLAHHGLKHTQKVLIYGPPGVGKSMGAERIAWNIGLPFYKVRFEALLSSYLGESLKNLRNIFDMLNTKPAVLLLDEFDFIGKTRNYGQDVGEMSRLVNQLLFLLDEFNSNSLIIATTNLESIIDQALFRRFDEVIKMQKPDNTEILELLQMSLSSMQVEKGIKWTLIVTKMKNFSSADIVKVAQKVSKLSILNNDKIIKFHHFEKVLKELS
jgi:SpoVK/Ycf46/Vps4 family AAA+-type ATPase